MKAKYISVLSLLFLAFLLADSYRLAASESGSVICSGSLIVHSQPGLKGKWCCANQSGEFEIGTNGTFTITNLCSGNYTICVFGETGGTYTGDYLFANNFYDCYINNSGLDTYTCPCNQ